MQCLIIIETVVIETVSLFYYFLHDSCHEDFTENCLNYDKHILHKLGL
jgi:hypothetical protein